jgi:hypothetical protein
MTSIGQHLYRNPAMTSKLLKHVAWNSWTSCASVNLFRLELDWSQHVLSKDDELKLEWSDDPESEEETAIEAKNKNKLERQKSEKGKSDHENDLEDEVSENPAAKTSSGTLDIMAQQLKFIACLKIMMEELATLATGFEVDGGLLR